VVDVAPTTRALAAIEAAYYARGEVREAKRASTTARGPSTACTSPPEDRIAGFWWTPWRTVAGSIRLSPWRFDGRQDLPKHLQRDDVDPRFKKGTRRSLSPMSPTTRPDTGKIRVELAQQRDEEASVVYRYKITDEAAGIDHEVPDKDEPLIKRIGGTPVPHRRAVSHPRYPEPGRR
jgi:hypothetical protein